MFPPIGRMPGGIQADHSLGLSDSRCFSLLSSTRTDKIESESYASDENICSVHPGKSRILDSLTGAQACLALWVLRTGYNEVKGRLPVSYINVLYHMQGETWHCHISDWVQEVLGFILFVIFFI